MEKECKDGKPRACATDGRRLIVATWDEPDANEFPKLDGVDLSKPKKPKGKGKKKPTGTIVPLTTWEKARKAIPKSSTRPILQHAVLEETEQANGNVRMAVTDLETTEKFESRPIEGHYPDFDSVIPKNLDGHTKVGVNPTYLCEVIKIVAEMIGNDDPTIVLHTPDEADKPLELGQRGRCRNNNQLVKELSPAAATRFPEQHQRNQRVRRQVQQRILHTLIRQRAPEGKRLEPAHFVVSPDHGP